MRPVESISKGCAPVASVRAACGDGWGAPRGERGGEKLGEAGGLLAAVVGRAAVAGPERKDRGSIGRATSWSVSSARNWSTRITDSKRRKHMKEGVGDGHDRVAWRTSAVHLFEQRHLTRRYTLEVLGRNDALKCTIG